MPWWLLLVLVAGLSWLLANGAVYFYYSHLGELLNLYGENPPEELLQRWIGDGGKRVFALYFGWFYGFVYLVPWLGFYGVLQFVLHLFSRRRSVVAQQGAPADANKSGAAEL